MPAMQTPRTLGYPADAIAGKPAPTDPTPACRSRACPRCKRRVLMDTPPTPSLASQLQQNPRQPVGAGLARDAASANALTPHRGHRRQASSNRALASCRSRACPRCKRRELTGTPRAPSQASLHPTSAIPRRRLATSGIPRYSLLQHTRCQRPVLHQAMQAGQDNTEAVDLKEPT